jgi:hypothetical protein
MLEIRSILRLYDSVQQLSQIRILLQAPILYNTSISALWICHRSQEHAARLTFYQASTPISRPQDWMHMSSLLTILPVKKCNFTICRLLLEVALYPGGWHVNIHASTSNRPGEIYPKLGGEPWWIRYSGVHEFSYSYTIPFHTS